MYSIGILRCLRYLREDSKMSMIFSIGILGLFSDVASQELMKRESKFQALAKGGGAM